MMNTIMNQHYSFIGTTRPPKENEINGRHYHFVQKEEFLRSLQSKQMLDHVEYDGYHIGLSINTIRTVMTSGKTCILILPPKVSYIICMTLLNDIIHLDFKNSTLYG